MTDHDNKKVSQTLDTNISKVFERLNHEENITPPSALDALILQQAADAVANQESAVPTKNENSPIDIQFRRKQLEEAQKKQHKKSLLPIWAMPMTLAATVLLSFGIVTRIMQNPEFLAPQSLEISDETIARSDNSLRENTVISADAVGEVSASPELITSTDRETKAKKEVEIIQQKTQSRNLETNDYASTMRKVEPVNAQVTRSQTVISEDRPRLAATPEESPTLAELESQKIILDDNNVMARSAPSPEFSDSVSTMQNDELKKSLSADRVEMADSSASEAINVDADFATAFSEQVKPVRFQIPENYALNENAGFPASYLEYYAIDDVEERLNLSERNSLACLLKDAEQTNQFQYKQTYYLDVQTPIIALFRMNYPTFDQSVTWEGKSFKDNQLSGLVSMQQISDYIEQNQFCSN